MKINAANERIKRRYLTYLREAKQLGEQSVDSVAKALDRFETHTGRRDFKRFRHEQAISFKKRLGEQSNARTGEKLSKATIYSTLGALRSFFFWLAGQPGFKSRLRYSDGDYFNTSLKDTAIAKARRAPRVPTINQICSVLDAMPTGTPVQRRNRALIAFTLLTGARDNATASFRLKHIDLDEGVLHHDARDVRVKFAKTFPTWFFPVGDEIRQIVVAWVAFLRSNLGFGPEDPLFPKTGVAIGEDGSFETGNLSRERWSTTAPIRSIFKEAFAAAGLPYFNPHSFRKTLVQLGMDTCPTPMAVKAWSQNLGHDDVLTTFKSYGELSDDQQRALMRNAAAPTDDEDRRAMEIGRFVLNQMRETAGSTPLK